MRFLCILFNELNLICTEKSTAGNSINQAPMINIVLSGLVCDKKNHVHNKNTLYWVIEGKYILFLDHHQISTCRKLWRWGVQSTFRPATEHVYLAWRGVGWEWNCGVGGGSSTRNASKMKLSKPGINLSEPLKKHCNHVSIVIKVSLKDMGKAACKI